MINLKKKEEMTSKEVAIYIEVGRRYEKIQDADNKYRENTN